MENTNGATKRGPDLSTERGDDDPRIPGISEKSTFDDKSTIERRQENHLASLVSTFAQSIPLLLQQTGNQKPNPPMAQYDGFYNGLTPQFYLQLPYGNVSNVPYGYYLSRGAPSYVQGIAVDGQSQQVKNLSSLTSQGGHADTFASLTQHRQAQHSGNDQPMSLHPISQHGRYRISSYQPLNTFKVNKAKKTDDTGNKAKYNVNAMKYKSINSRPHVCTFPDCEWAFARQSDLRRHAKSHSEPTFHCPYWRNDPTCHRNGGAFNRLDVLKRHLKLVHYVHDKLQSIPGSKDDPGWCRACQRMFNDTKSFIKHCLECAQLLSPTEWKNNLRPRQLGDLDGSKEVKHQNPIGRDGRSYEQEEPLNGYAGKLSDDHDDYEIPSKKDDMFQEKYIPEIETLERDAGTLIETLQSQPPNTASSHQENIISPDQNNEKDSSHFYVDKNLSVSGQDYDSQITGLSPTAKT